MRLWRPAARSIETGRPEGEASRSVQELERRLADAERGLEDAQRKIAALEVELAASARRANALIDLTEQRFDLIYRRVTGELARLMAGGSLGAETEAAVDARLAQLLSAGLRAQVDPGRLDLETILSETLRPGLLRCPLSLYGFRLERGRARELGDAIMVRGLPADAYGTAVYGPYKRLAPGRYRVSLSLAPAPADPAPADAPPQGELALDVYSPGSRAVLGQSVMQAADIGQTTAIAVDFEWSRHSASDVVEFRLHQRSSVAVMVTSVGLEVSKSA